MPDIAAINAKPQAEYKEAMQALLREAGPRVFMAYYERLMDAESVKVDDLRKGVELIIGATDAALERKTDANANLPTFNITFDITTGAMAASEVVEEAKPVDQVEDAVEVRPALAPEQSAELDEMFKLLDSALGL